MNRYHEMLAEDLNNVKIEVSDDAGRMLFFKEAVFLLF